jgi:Ca2+-binding RTX toxin-like protein
LAAETRGAATSGESDLALTRPLRPGDGFLVERPGLPDYGACELERSIRSGDRQKANARLTTHLRFPGPRSLLGAAARVAALALPATALAATFEGTPGPDHLVGTDDADTITGLAGDDVLEGLGGNDDIDGGADNDWIAGGFGNDRIDGGGGRDRIRGGPGADLIGGGEGADAIAGGDGFDVIRGGPGPDLLLGGNGNDLIGAGAGRDLVYGGWGNDEIFVAGDATPDAVRCGPGWDVVHLGRYDVADRSCEKVVRTLE